MVPHCDFTIGSLMVLAKEGNLELHQQVRSKLNRCKEVFCDTKDYKPTVINTPYLIPKERVAEMGGTNNLPGVEQPAHGKFG